MTSTPPSGPHSHNLAALSRSKRRPALDGVRALSVIVVMVYHANPDWIPGGFLSVNVFFLLSGYLITGLLLKEIKRWGSIDLTSFYKNRARRLLPALFVVVVAITLIGRNVLDAGAKGHLRGDAVSTLFYVANWRFILEGESYFAGTGDASPFRHMWTLAIEEQFYLLFPLLMIALVQLARGRRRVIARSIVGLAALSVVWQAYLYKTSIETMKTPDPSRLYYGTDTRASELLLGAALAVAMTYWNKRKLRAREEGLTWLGIAAFIGMFAFFFFAHEFDGWIFMGGSTLFCILLVIVILAIEIWPTSLFAELLSWRPIVYIGEISYGLYLWHWPIFVFLNEDRTGWSTLVLLTVRLALTFALAAFSYKFIEQPIRMQKLQKRIGRTPSIIAWTAALPAALAIVLIATQGIKGVTDAKAGEEVRTQTGNTSGQWRIGVIGDSVGYGLALQFPGSKYPQANVSGSAKIGCGTAEQWLVVNNKPQSEANSDCDDIFSAWKAALDAQKPQVVVWSMGGWDIYDHYINGKVLKEESPEYAEYYRKRLEEGLKVIGPNPQVFIPLIPCYNQPSYVVEGEDLAPNRNDPKRAAALNKIITDFAKAHPKQVHTANPASWLCPGGKFVEKLDGKKMRLDGVHYTSEGADKFWTWLMPQLEPYLPKNS